jgi:hypothetical protein
MKAHIGTLGLRKSRLSNCGSKVRGNEKVHGSDD